MPFPRQEYRYPTAAAIKRLSSDLGLAEVFQDWEIEAAAPDRVGAFLDYDENNALDDDERFSLMSLIVASFDERLDKGHDGALEDRIVAHLIAGFDVLNYLVHYWAMPDTEDTEEVFNFTPTARRIMASRYGSRERWPRTPQVILQSVDALVELSDERDGTFHLWWRGIAGRDSGGREVSSVHEAVAYARDHLGVPEQAWRKIE